MNNEMDLFITCGQGIEPLLTEELRALGYSEIISGYRGVTVKRANLEAIYKINYCSRLAGRVFLPRCQSPL
jgi:putative N6-adenine-specific DNA methylase